MDNALDVLTAAVVAVRPTMPNLLAQEWTTDLAAWLDERYAVVKLPAVVLTPDDRTLWPLPEIDPPRGRGCLFAGRIVGSHCIGSRR